jgi:hypothetical protein
MKMPRFIRLLLFALTLALPHPLSYAHFSEQLPYVTCNIMGGLGNQMFEIATTLAYAWDYGARATFPDLASQDYNIPLHRREIFFRLDASVPDRIYETWYEERNWHDSETIPYRRDQKLFGYLQSWIRFNHHREKLLDVFAPSDAVLTCLGKKYGDLISHPYTVALHVRTFNFKLHAMKIHPFMGVEYYQRAMALFPADALFVVFSDRINWCKKHFLKLGRPCVFIEGNSETEDLFLMSMMKHQVIPNSTFAWWAAYLNKNPDKIVVAPSSWQHPDIQSFPIHQPNEFYLPDWLILSPNYEEPYPPDMTDYDFSAWDGN